MTLNQCPIWVQKKWDLVPNDIKQSENLNAFKFGIKRPVPEGFP